jgi:predicted nucleic acid-binding protein
VTPGEFLIDTSAAVRILQPKVAAAWAGALEQGRVAMCDVTELEILYSARSTEHFNAIKQRMSELYTWRCMPDTAWRDAKEWQRRLVSAGAHRSAGISDLLVAVTAVHHGLTVLHYDRDFETLAKVTDVETQWLMEPGSLD